MEVWVSLSILIPPQMREEMARWIQGVTGCLALCPPGSSSEGSENSVLEGWPLLLSAPLVTLFSHPQGGVDASPGCLPWIPQCGQGNLCLNQVCSPQMRFHVQMTYKDELLEKTSKGMKAAGQAREETKDTCTWMSRAAFWGNISKPGTTQMSSNSRINKKKMWLYSHNQVLPSNGHSWVKATQQARYISQTGIIFVTHTPNKGLISLIYKEFLQVKRKTKNWIETWTANMNRQ